MLGTNRNRSRSISNLRRMGRVACLALGLATPTLLTHCSSQREHDACVSGCEVPCRSGAGDARGCVDLPPVAKLRFQVSPPRDSFDYPFAADAPATEAPAPGATLYLSAEGSADPDGLSIATFWSVQDPSAQYLAVDPSATSTRVSFTPSRAGLHTITLQITEHAGLRQTGQAQLKLEVAPHPCARDGAQAPCADALVVPGGTFLMGSSDGEGHESERPRHVAVLDAFALDQYEVTVGRFRRFLVDFTPERITAGAGAHPRHPGSGWRPEWIATLPASPEEFSFAIAECGGPWTEQVGAGEARPISCLTWFEAFAFCAWEDKRLPTEAEWEYAAAGGDEQRRYPWGSQPPSAELAVFGCLYDGLQSCSDADLPVAGSLPRGAGKYGQLDLAGSVWEWTLDAYAPFDSAVCDNCAVGASDTTARVFRGGDFKFADPDSLRASSRYAFLPAEPDPTRGVRCARSIPAPSR